MRIISSDGTIDVPYEAVVLFADSEGNVTYSFYGDSEFALWLHGYKDQNRASEVTRDIRNAYVMGRKVFILPKE